MIYTEPTGEIEVDKVSKKTMNIVDYQQEVDLKIHLLKLKELMELKLIKTILYK